MKGNLTNISIISNFVQVVEIGSISGAAEKLFLTQPTLSRQIAGLEEDLKVPLFKRVKNGVVLTNEGAVFYKQCKKFVRAYNEFIGKAFEFQNLVVGTLQISYQKASENLMIRYNSKFLKKYPGVEIQSQIHTAHNPLERLCEEELDLAYVYERELTRKYKDIKSLHVATCRNMLLVSKDNPLSQRDSVSMTELKDQPFILPSKSIAPFKANEPIANGHEVGFEPRVVATATNIVEFLQEIIRFNGVAVLPYLPEVDMMTTQVKYLGLEDYEQDYPICLAWNATNTNALIPLYVSFIQECLQHKQG